MYATIAAVAATADALSANLVQMQFLADARIRFKGSSRNQAAINSVAGTSTAIANGAFDDPVHGEQHQELSYALPRRLSCAPVRIDVPPKESRRRLVSVGVNDPVAIEKSIRLR